MSAQDLLDLSKPINVAVLDATVNAFLGATHNEDERAAADQILMKLKEHPDSWRQVSTIIEGSNNLNTKYFALQILEQLVNYRWGALPIEQQEGLKNYVSNLIVAVASNPRAFYEQRIFMLKLNVVLVGILKHTWPHRWTSFVKEMVEASKTSETLCENSMEVFKLLSEEVFDFSRGNMTGAKIRDLKHSLKDEFALIHQLCSFVLNNSTNTRLIQATLSALHAYLSWVPIAFIFQGNLVDCLLNLFPQEPFRNIALKCLTEIGGLSVEEFGPQFVMFYKVFLTQLQTLWHPLRSLEEFDNDCNDFEDFVLNLAEFLTTFLRTHHNLLETNANDCDALICGLQYLVKISYYEDMEVFKTCLEFWNYFVVDVFTHDMQIKAEGRSGQLKSYVFSEVLCQIRGIMIARMAKPEEVIIVEDENGNAVRETLKDSDVLQQYKTMRETLVYLSNLDQADTENQMLTKLRMQMDASQNAERMQAMNPNKPFRFSWLPLNTLCWAVGSISGTMDEEQESRFLVTVIRDLLSLCERTRGKDNKAIIASNIMCVVGQYPRFLRAHWKFLKTVVNKLFEFMHETHPGVQDMACDTFLKICSKCKAQFVMHQKDETEKFVMELLRRLESIIQDLSPAQISVFYESVGLMISAEHDNAAKRGFLDLLMRPPNKILEAIISAAERDVQTLTTEDTVRRIHHCLQANTAVCKSLGADFMPQMQLFFTPYLVIYKQYSELISNAIQSGDPYAARSSFVKALRSVKRAVLQLLEVFIQSSDLPDITAKEMVLEMMDPILGDYSRNVPDARDAEVLSLFATIIQKFGMTMENEVPRIFTSVFECTLQMITKNFEDHPEHRVNFFSLLQSITKHCFPVLYTMSQEQLTLIIDSVVWAFRHTMRNVAETGLLLLEDLIFNFSTSPLVLQFYKAFYIKIMREIFSVMTDTFHKPGFKLQCKILHMLFMSVQDQNLLNGPIWDVNEKGIQAYPSNAAFVGEFVYGLLEQSFPNMTDRQIKICITGMFDIREFQTFKHHLRDFLVQTKQFETQDNTELFADDLDKTRQEEKAKIQNIPGMTQPQ